MASIIGVGKAKYFRFEKAQKRKNHKKIKSYVKRDELLSLLGYISYKDYLSSDDWKIIRERWGFPRRE